MRIGVVSDFHLGGTKDSRWNNLQLQRHASKIARAAIRRLNEQAPDVVFVTGDLTEDGYREGDWTHQLKLARVLLDGLTLPWKVVPGNHDRTLVKSGDFDRVMGEHVLPMYSRAGDLGIVALREGPAVTGNTYSSIGQAQIEQVVAAVRQDPAEQLLIFSHFPLISEEAFSAKNNGKYPGHFEDGAVLLEQLGRVASKRIVVFAGHMHWHLVTASPTWIQCTTGGMIEYPVELRMVTLEANCIRFQVMNVAASEFAKESLVEGGGWVSGEAKDRKGALTLTI
jgi:hypothetical protein